MYQRERWARILTPTSDSRWKMEMMIWWYIYHQRIGRSGGSYHRAAHRKRPTRVGALSELYHHCRFQWTILPALAEAREDAVISSSRPEFPGDAASGRATTDVLSAGISGIGRRTAQIPMPRVQFVSCAGARAIAVAIARKLISAGPTISAGWQIAKPGTTRPGRIP